MELQVPGHTVLSVVVGSRAYGLETESSDVDRRGVFVAPTPLFWRLDKPPTHVEGPMPEQFSWEIERFCVLALQANPTVLECLWSPIVEHSGPLGDGLLAIRQAFLSRKAERTFAGYADEQLRRLGSLDSPDGDVRPRKMAMHMIRLLLSGLHLARHGEPLVRVDAHRDRLLAVRRGDLDWPEVRRWRDELAAQIAEVGSVLPERPDRDTVEDFLITARRSSL
ncbi:nucleotidyltransferase domain-containing protein [Planotetraspora sp. A-T 1434]|uniref:nucleotidyltransferase domain-containing protein n=1 Tax=Planotetraspora sp. A-T 1434 TaxID=2979219 RepID=UPI0021BE659B|nr:nucleotidyltransferase domain-containing protein [Planotetraspora sp. A-T 1434]MCT9935089.1 nucleotidyltransferase domain-containing protein [Planotetraspora sp. A-T 1434]